MDLTYCRLCLQLSKHEFSVFDLITTSNDGSLKISEMIYTCVNLLIKNDDNIIHNICDPCINDVIRCYNFRRKCHESDRLLNMKIGGLLNEHNDFRIKIEHEDDDFCIKDITSNILCRTKEDLDVSTLETCSEIPEVGVSENRDILIEDSNNELEPDALEVKHDIEFRNHSIKEKQEYKCTVCAKDFKNVTLLRLHSEVHSNRNNYLCGICGQGFKQKQGLRAHNVRKHTAQFKCQICNKTYVGNSQLFAHMRGHTGERPFSCEICGSTFARKYSVDIHMRTHTGERPFKCRYCDKTFIMHSHRRNHEINHMDSAEIENYSCVVCLKVFKRKDLYNLHLKVHSDERNEKCKFCFKKFKSRKSLSSHVRHIHKKKKEE